MSNSKEILDSLIKKIKEDFDEEIDFNGLIEITKDILSQKEELINHMVQLTIFNELNRVGAMDLAKFIAYMEDRTPVKPPPPKPKAKDLH